MGRSTGNTTGILIDDSFTPVFDTYDVYFFFKDCYIIKDIHDANIFFEPGDSGSGVYIEGNDKSPKKALGIAFADKTSTRETAVCKISHIKDMLNLELYEA